MPATDTGGSQGQGNSQQTTQLTALTNTRASFGSATYNTTSTGTGNTVRRGTATASRGNAGRALGSSTNLTVDGFTAGSSGVSLSVMPHYVASIEFATAARPTGELQGELKTMLSSDWNSAWKNVEVRTEGRTWVIRGEVSSEKERRKVENQVRLTPGWSEIHNELKVKP